MKDEDREGTGGALAGISPIHENKNIKPKVTPYRSGGGATRSTARPVYDLLGLYRK